MKAPRLDGPKSCLRQFSTSIRRRRPRPAELEDVMVRVEWHARGSDCLLLMSLSAILLMCGVWGSDKRAKTNTLVMILLLLIFLGTPSFFSTGHAAHDVGDLPSQGQCHQEVGNAHSSSLQYTRCEYGDLPRTGSPTLRKKRKKKVQHLMTEADTLSYKVNRYPVAIFYHTTPLNSSPPPTIRTPSIQPSLLNSTTNYYNIKSNRLDSCSYIPLKRTFSRPSTKTFAQDLPADIFYRRVP